MVMYKLTFEKRSWIVKQILDGKSSSKTALAQKVSRISVFRIMRYIENLVLMVLKTIKHHNNERPHMSLNYKTPKEIWNKLKNVNQLRDVNQSRDNRQGLGNSKI